MHAIGKNIRDTNLPDGTSGSLRQLQIAHGYDNNWVLHGQGTYRLAAVAQDPGNGVTLRTFTDQPGVQFYIEQLPGRRSDRHDRQDVSPGRRVHARDPALPGCAQPHRPAEWPSVVVGPGKTFTSRTAFAFSVDGHSLKGANPFK